MNKFFIITVDTEGDNLWHRATTPYGLREITTLNANYITRFQKICQKYNFTPTYLVDYEMACSETFVELSREWLLDNVCEIGMHMHSWNTPPIVSLPFSYKGHNPYAGEYSHKYMYEKINYLTEFIYNTFGVVPKSHRGGRWYIDSWYIKQLIKLGYVIDCSITPGINWGSCIGNSEGGPDYSKYPMKSFYMDKEKNFLQVPPTIIKDSLKKRCNELIKRPYDFRKIINKRLWLRPNGKNVDDMLNIIKAIKKKPIDYLEFMIHSSELMPGGSPTFIDDKDIEKLYIDLETIFSVISEDFKGVTLFEYYNNVRGRL